MDLSPILIPKHGDHPAWHMGGPDEDIPILFLEGGPRDQHGFLKKVGSWSIRPLTYGSYDEALRYFRELAQAATELADRLEQMEGEAAKQVLDQAMTDNLNPREEHPQ